MKDNLWKFVNNHPIITAIIISDVVEALVAIFKKKKEDAE